MRTDRKKVAPAMETPLESSDRDHENKEGKKSLGGAGADGTRTEAGNTVVVDRPFFLVFCAHASHLPSLVPLSPASSLPADHWLPA